MEKYYQIFRLEPELSYEPGYCTKTVKRSRLKHVSRGYAKTKEEALSILEFHLDGCSEYVIMEVYR